MQTQVSPAAAPPAGDSKRAHRLVGGPADGVEFADGRLPGRWFIPHPWSGFKDGRDRSDVCSKRCGAWHSYGLAANSRSQAVYRYEGWMCSG